MTSDRRRVSTVVLPLILVALLATAVWPQDPNFAQKLYGNWYTYPHGNPKTDATRHEFWHNNANGSDEMVMTRSCMAESRVVSAKAVSPIEVSEDTIRVLKSASDAQPIQGTAMCEVSINAGVLGYSFSEDGEHLILTEPGGNPDYLELARDIKASEAPVPQRLYGTWLLPPINSKEMRLQIRWVFYRTAERQDKVRQIAVCTKGNDSLVSHIDSEISLSPEQIKIVQSASHTEGGGSFTCQASISSGTWRYTLAPTGLTLTLYAAGAKPVTLTREQESGLN